MRIFNLLCMLFLLFFLFDCSSLGTGSSGFVGECTSECKSSCTHIENNSSRYLNIRNEIATGARKKDIMYEALESLIQDTCPKAFAKLNSTNPVQEKKENQLITAVKNNDDAAVSKLLKAGINPNAREVDVTLGPGSFIKTALVIATANKNLKIVELLVKGGASVNEKCDITTITMMGTVYKYGGHSPLHVSLSNNPPIDLKIVKLLLNKGADVNARDAIESTPMITLCSNKTMDDNIKKAFNLLIGKKANINLANKFGSTALSIAQKNNNEVLVAMLKKSGAK